MNVQGGRRPYRLISSQPGILPVPAEINEASFTVIPNNPGVIDTGIAVNELPVRSVIISVTDQTNGFNTATIQVAQNFLTSYGVFYTSTCPAGAASAAAACAGGETAVRIEANFNGALIGNRQFRLDILRGPEQWVFNPGGAIIGNSVTVTTDHQGKTSAIFRVPPGTPTQIGVFRVTDVATGVSTEQVFVIEALPTTSQKLTILPDAFTFTGPDTASCGTGSGDILVFDGVPPYTATSAFGSVTVSPPTSTTQPGRFTLTAGSPQICLTDATIVVTDANGARGTVKISTKPGTADPPPTPLRAIPSTITLSCGESANVLVAGGDGTAVINANSTDPDITAIGGTGRTVQITRNAVPGPTPSATVVTSTVTVTDGTSTAVISVRNPTNCT
ncbi:MAG: hypothetical protein ABIQ72_11180 [Usitatibacter sp.]